MKTSTQIGFLVAAVLIAAFGFVAATRSSVVREVESVASEPSEPSEPPPGSSELAPIPSEPAPTRSVAATDKSSDPESPLGTVEISTLQPMTPSPDVRFRAVNIKGRVLAGELIEGTREGVTNGSERVDRMTDANGEFELDTPLRRASRYAFTFRLQSRSSGPLVGFHPSGGTSPRREALPIEIVFRPIGVLVAGHVLDRDGRGVGGAEVELWTNTYSRGRRRPTDTLRTQTSGAFEFVGEPLHDHYELRAVTETAQLGPLAVTRGERDVVLQEFDLFTIDMEVRVGRLARKELSITLEPKDVHAKRVRSSVQPERFSMPPVREGEYELVVRANGEGLERRTVYVGPGAPHEEFDLRGRLQAHGIIVENVTENYERRLQTRWRPAADGDSWPEWQEHLKSSGGLRHRMNLYRGEPEEPESLAPLRTPTWWTTAKAIDVQVRVSGYRDVELRGVSGKIVVRLEPGPSVRVVLVTDGKLPAPPNYLGITVNGGHCISNSGKREFTNDARELVFVFSGAGKQHVMWWRTNRVKGRISSESVLHTRGTVLDIRDVAEQQRFELHLDAETLAEIFQDAR